MVRPVPVGTEPSVAPDVACKLWLVRHAQPCVASGVCYGSMDVAADALATRAAAQALAQALPQGVQVTSSPLQRCEQLAQEIYGLRPDLTYKVDCRLAEMNFGRYEGQRWDSIARDAYDAWTTDFWQHRFGGAQSVAEFMTRVQAAWDEAALTGKQAIWITHAGVIRAASLLAQGVCRVDCAQGWPQTAPAFGQWCVLGLGPRNAALQTIVGSGEKDANSLWREIQPSLRTN